MKKQSGFILPLILVILVVGGVYVYSKKDTEVKVTDTNSQVSPISTHESVSNLQNSETRKFRLYRKHDGYVYLVGTEYPESVYYKSNEADKFKNYNELDYLQIIANSYTNLSAPEKENVGIKDYTVDITKQINGISDITTISEAEFDPVQ